MTNIVAGHLKAAGIRPGDRVGLHFPNNSELALSYYGCFKAGAIAVPINTRLKGREIDYMLRHSAAAGYIGQHDLSAEVMGLRKELPALRLCYVNGEEPPASGVAPVSGDLLRPLPSPVSLPCVAARTGGGNHLHFWDHRATERGNALPPDTGTNRSCDARNGTK